MNSKALHLSLLAALLVGCFSLTGCLSHWFVDSTTRLQIENQTGSDIVEIDIVSEDGKTIRPWIQDTIKDGETSRVYEEDWVGSFHWRLVYTNTKFQCSCVTTTYRYASASETSSSGMASKSCYCTDTRLYKGYFDIELSGGSYYLVFSRNDDGSIHVESR